ncbi:MAG: NAD(P)H-hydrate dehydratase [Gemmatimonadota bacterium]
MPTAAEMSALDSEAVSGGSISERALIESAGREIAHLVQDLFPNGPIAAIVGSGHNGADALVALRALYAWGRTTFAFKAGRRAPAPDVLAGWDIGLRPASDLSHAAGCSALLDGILGTGLVDAPREEAAAAIAAVNSLGVPVVAVDVPSGVNATTGAVPGACVRADLTVCLGWPKLGMLRPPARELAGDVVAVEIGFPPTPALRSRAITGRWLREHLPEALSRRSKSDAGYLALIAGREGMAGAAVLAARAALRAGAGVVRVVSHPANREIIQKSVPGAVYASWADERELSGALDWAHAMVVGPGLGRDAEARRLTESVLSSAGARPVVLDADGLSVWEGAADELPAHLPPSAVMTPHPGEMARVLDRDIESILENPFVVAEEASERFGCTVLLKGDPTIVAAPDEPLLVATTRGPALAAGGTGDVVAGVTGALLANGLAGHVAASGALLLTGLAASQGPAIGHTAEDIPDRLQDARAAVAGLEKERGGSVLFALPRIGDPKA